MSGSQTTNGKAYEHAIANELASKLNVPITEDNSSEFARRCFALCSQSVQKKFQRTAETAVEVILEQEPWLVEAEDVNIKLQPDKAGVRGDVRDILVTSVSGRTVGISCKTNHEALKHPRLSGSADFVSLWQIDPSGCCPTYWNAIRPIFAELSEIRVRSDGKALWEDQHDIYGRVYLPVLEAWSKESIRAVKHQGREQDACRGLVQYLFGSHDFYKVIGRHGTSLECNVLGVNFNGTLSTKRSRLPTNLLGIDNNDGGQNSRIMRFDKGFSLSFRIHSASKRIEPSLKFDINALSLPTALFFQHTETVS